MRAAILYPGSRDARVNATHENNRFSHLFGALSAAGMRVEPAVYHDDFCDDVREQLLRVDGVLVWVNPIEAGRDRSLLDAMLRDVSAAGVFVSAHPDVISKLGTKEVLYRTRELGWGCDTQLYADIDQMRRGLCAQLANGEARVLKRIRGNGGDGVWKIQRLQQSASHGNDGGTETSLSLESLVLVRHAKRGCIEEKLALGEFLSRCEPYFSNAGGMINQQYQERLPEGMVRCYLVHDQVAGFGHQAVNALYPAPAGQPPALAPEPGPRLYHPSSKPEFQALKDKLEQTWLPSVQHALDIDTAHLPILWDCDFLLGPKDKAGKDTYVLCEINTSSVAPFPDSALPYVVAALRARLQETRSKRSSDSVAD